MKSPAGSLLAALLATLLVGAGCAPPIERTPQPPPPRPAPAPAVTPAERPRSGANAARQQRALDLRHRGDLAASLTQWRILRTLVPDDPEVQRQVAATRALIRHRVQERLFAGAAAERAGEPTEARNAYLQALAVDPNDGDALTRLRSMETTAVYAVQQARLDRLRARRAQAVARKTEGRTAPAQPSGAEHGNGQERDYRDMGIALFEAGDYEASILELRKYLGSFPEDDVALGVLRKAEARAQEGAPRADGPLPQSTPTAGAVENTPRRPALASAAVPPAAPAVTPPAVTAADEEAAQDLYERGVRVYRQELSAAIRLWEQSLERDPSHVQARLRLEQAHRMQQRLEAIDSQ